MTLTQEDKKLIQDYEWQVEDLVNEIKNLYRSIYKKPNLTLVGEQFKKLSDEDKLLIMNDEILKMAKK